MEVVFPTGWSREALAEQVRKGIRTSSRGRSGGERSPALGDSGTRGRNCLKTGDAVSRAAAESAWGKVGRGGVVTDRGQAG